MNLFKLPTFSDHLNEQKINEKLKIHDLTKEHLEKERVKYFKKGYVLFPETIPVLDEGRPSLIIGATKTQFDYVTFEDDELKYDYADFTKYVDDFKFSKGVLKKLMNAHPYIVGDDIRDGNLHDQNELIYDWYKNTSAGKTIKPKKTENKLKVGKFALKAPSIKKLDDQGIFDKVLELVEKMKFISDDDIKDFTDWVTYIPSLDDLRKALYYGDNGFKWLYQMYQDQ